MADLRFSIVEPYWERAEALRAQLESFRKVYGGRDDWELVIVDDGSPTEPARPVVDEFPDLPINLIVNPMRQPDDTKDPCVPMNQAAAAAKSDMLILSQADIEHANGCVAVMLLDLYESLPNDKVVMYPCCMDLMFPNADRWRCNQFTPLPTTDCTLIRKEHFFSVGGFFEGYRDGYACSDTDFMRGLLEDDAIFVVVPNVVVSHRGDICPQWRDTDPRKERWRASLKMLRERRGPFVTFVTHPIPARTEDGTHIMPISISADMVEKKVEEHA